jgi:hypothetical protein
MASRLKRASKLAIAPIRRARLWTCSDRRARCSSKVAA